MSDDYTVERTKELVHYCFMIIEAAQRYKYHKEYNQLTIMGQSLYVITQILVGLRRRHAKD